MVPVTVAWRGTRPSTNSTVSYGPQAPFLTPAGSSPKSIRRRSPISIVWSGIARMEKAASLSPTAIVTLAGIAVWSAAVAPSWYDTSSGIVIACCALIGCCH